MLLRAAATRWAPGRARPISGSAAALARRGGFTGLSKVRTRQRKRFARASRHARVQEAARERQAAPDHGELRTAARQTALVADRRAAAELAAMDLEIADAEAHLAALALAHDDGAREPSVYEALEAADVGALREEARATGAGWAHLVRALAVQGEFDEALRVADSLPQEQTEEDGDVLAFLFNGAARRRSAEFLARVMARADQRPRQLTPFALTSMLEAQARCGRLDLAVDTLQQLIKDPSQRSPQPFSMIVQECLRRREPERAWAAFRVLQAVDVQPDLPLFSQMMEACALTREPNRALELWTDLQREGLQPDAGAYAALIRAQASDWTHAFRAFDLAAEMRAVGVRMDERTFGALLHACAAYGDVPRAWRILRAMERRGLVTQHALATMLHVCSRAASLGRKGGARPAQPAERARRDMLMSAVDKLEAQHSREDYYGVGFAFEDENREDDYYWSEEEVERDMDFALDDGGDGGVGEGVGEDEEAEFGQFLAELEGADIGGDEDSLEAEDDGDGDDDDDDDETQLQPIDHTAALVGKYDGDLATPLADSLPIGAWLAQTPTGAALAVFTDTQPGCVGRRQNEVIALAERLWAVQAERGLAPDVVGANAMLSVYAEALRLRRAAEFLDETFASGAVAPDARTLRIGARMFLRAKRVPEALALLDRFQREFGVEPDRDTLELVVLRLAQRGNAQGALLAHRRALDRGLELREFALRPLYRLQRHGLVQSGQLPEDRRERRSRQLHKANVDGQVEKMAKRLATV